MKINIKNKDVKELMSILLGNNISNFDKKIVNLILKKRISYFSNNYYENISSLREFFYDLSKKKDLKDYLYDLSLPSYIKKYIIDYGYNDDSYSSDLLKMNISYDLKEYIVINKITRSDKIINLLKDDLIDNKLKKLCVKKNIDTFNIINIMLNEKINDYCRSFILSIKKNLFITKLSICLGSTCDSINDKTPNINPSFFSIFFFFSICELSSYAVIFFLPFNNYINIYNFIQVILQLIYKFINCNNKCRTFYNKITKYFTIRFLPFLNLIYIQTLVSTNYSSNLLYFV